jgi:hypothetical protein
VSGSAHVEPAVAVQRVYPNSGTEVLPESD